MNQQEYWNDQAGPVWVALQEGLDRQLQPLGEAALARLDARAGERIVDVGCGAGQTSLLLAQAVGSTGSVLGVDISRPLLELARRRAEGTAWLEFREGDAQSCPLPPGDAVFSRFGVMFFADPAAAFANLRAALRPGGRIVFACWRDVSLNTFMTLPMQATASIVPPPPPPDPDAPGPFALAAEPKLRGLLAGAGFAQVELTAHDQAIGGGSLDEATQMALQLGPLAQALREHPERAVEVKAAVREALAPHLTPQGVLLPSACWIVSARC